MKRYLKHRSTLLALLTVGTILGSSPAQASFSNYVTSHQWDLTDLNDNGANDCGAGSYDGLAADHKSEGGWFEFLFTGHDAQGNSGGVQSGWLQFEQAVRSCPQSYSETNWNHSHGVKNAKTATWNGVVYSVYDQSSGYFDGAKIMLQQDPSKLAQGPNINEPYTVASLWANKRNYVDIDPGSANYVGGDDPDVCVGDPPQGVPRWDPLWPTHSGFDHRRTHCAAPARHEAVDPDIAIKAWPNDDTEGDVVVVWTERYVDGMAGVPYGLWVQYGFDPQYTFVRDTTYPFQPPAEFPYADSFKVHVAVLDANDIEGGKEKGPSVPRTYISPTNGLNFSVAGYAYGARVTMLSAGSYNEPVVVWAEENGSSDTLHAKRFTNGAWAWMSSGIDDVCNPSVVESGHASGRKTVDKTATHDVGTMNRDGVDVPVIVYLAEDGAACKLKARIFNPSNSTWELMGQADLRDSTSSGLPSSPRIAVKDNIAYMTWAESAGSANRNVYVRRWNAATDNWDLVGDEWNTGSGVVDAYKPSIAIGGSSTGCLGASTNGMCIEVGKTDIFVSLLERHSTNAPFFTNVYTCKIGNFGPNPTCIGDPKTRIQENFSSQPGMYVGGQHELGVATADPVNILDHSQGYVREAQQLVDGDGPTDITYTDAITDRTYAKMWVSWTGAIDDHRANDQMLYMRDTRLHRVDELVVHAGVYHGISKAPDGLFAWGLDNYGQLGVNEAGGGGSAIPLSVPLSFTPFDAGAGGYHSCVISEDRDAYCWGRNNYGQLGDGTYNNTPVVLSQPISGLGVVEEVALGFYFSCARNSVGNVYCWGSGSNGTRGSPGSQWPNSPTLVLEGTGNLENVVSLSAGLLHACAVKTDGKVFCWGYGAYGALGNGGTADKYTATQVSSIQEIVTVKAGGYHTCAQAADDEVYCWGYNAQGQLGLGDTTNRLTPVSVGVVDAYSPSLLNTCLLNDERISCSGYDAWGGVGNGTPNSQVTSFVDLGLMGVARLPTSNLSYANFAFREYVDQDQRAHTEWLAWGKGTAGELGHGSYASSSSPITSTSFWIDSGSCEGSCGASTGSCYCDTACHAAQDCCEDKVDMCGYTEPPHPTLTSTDIGDGIAGTTSISAPSYTIEGSGSDIWNTADGFRFVHKSLVGNGSVTAHIVSQENTHGWAKAGVMMRESLAANSRHAATVHNPAGDIVGESRASTGGGSISTTYTSGSWVRLTRSGDTFKYYGSADGSLWTEIGTHTVVMPDTVYVGLAVSSHDTQELSTAVFDYLVIE